jgi:hypothetical protein
MNALLRIESIKFKTFQTEWYNNSNYLYQTLKFVTERLTLATFHYMMKDRDEQFISITSANVFTKEFKSWNLGLWEFMSSNDLDSEFFMSIDILKDGFDLLLDVQVNKEETKQQLLDQYIQFCKTFYTYFKNITLIGYRYGIELYGVEFDRVKPVRLNGYWGISKLVDIASWEYHTKSPVGRPMEVKKIETLDLPDGAERILYDDLIIVKWVDNLKNLDYISLMLYKRDEWYANNFDLLIDQTRMI